MKDDSLIYVIDDDQAMIESLAWIIETIGLKAKTYTQAEDFLNEYAPRVPGCILMDVRMPGMSGPELQLKLNELKKSGIPVQPIIFISGYEDVSLTVRVMKAGALDFLTKPFNNQILLETINKAIRYNKETMIRQQEHKRSLEKFSSLSTREMQVLRGIIDGKPNKIISIDLNISMKTVEAHRASLMKKMKVKSISELVKIVLSNVSYEQISHV